MTRTIESLPMRLFAKGMAKHWNPAEIDFAQDAEDFAAMTDDERWMTMALRRSSSPERSR